jgi:hypothetical protein
MATLLDDVWKSKSSTINRILTKGGSPLSEDPLINKIALAKHYLKSNQLKGMARNIVGYPQFSKIALELGSLEDIKAKILYIFELKPLFNDVNLADLLHSLDVYTRPKFLYIFKGNVLEIHNLDSFPSLKQEIKISLGYVNLTNLLYSLDEYAHPEFFHIFKKVVLAYLDLDSSLTINQEIKPSSEYLNKNPHYYKGRIYFVREIQKLSPYDAVLCIFYIDLDSLEIHALYPIHDTNLEWVANNLYYYDVGLGSRYFDIATGKSYTLTFPPEALLNENGPSPTIDGQVIYTFNIEPTGASLFKHDTSLIRLGKNPWSLTLIPEVTQNIGVFKVIKSRLYFGELEIYDLETSRIIGRVDDITRYEIIDAICEYDGKIYALIHDDDNGDISIRVYQLPIDFSEGVVILKRLKDLILPGCCIYGIQNYGSKLCININSENISNLIVYDLESGQNTLDLPTINRVDSYTIG